MQGAAGQCVWKYACACVWVCLCVCAHYGFSCAPVDSPKKKKKKNAHVCVCICICALWVYLRVSAACICVFACALAGLCVSVQGRFVRAANTWGRGVLPAYWWASISLPLSPAQTPQPAQGQALKNRKNTSHNIFTVVSPWQYTKSNINQKHKLWNEEHCEYFLFYCVSAKGMFFSSREIKNVLSLWALIMLTCVEKNFWTLRLER